MVTSTAYGVRSLKSSTTNHCPSIRTEVHEYTSEDGDGNGNGNGDGEDNGNGQDNNGGDDNDSYEVVVTNEDVLNGTDSDVYENFNVTQVGSARSTLLVCS